MIYLFLSVLFKPISGDLDIGVILVWSVNYYCNYLFFGEEPQPIEISISWRPIVSTNNYLSLIIFKYVRTAKRPVRKGYIPLIHILATNSIIGSHYCTVICACFVSLFIIIYTLSEKVSPHPSFNNCYSKERMMRMKWLFKGITILFSFWKA